MTHAVFTPPTVRDIPRTVVGSDPGNELFKFFRPLERGISVFRLVDGSFTQQQPANDVGLAHTYHGGHEHPLDAVETAALTAAGYGAYITVVADPIPNDPLFANPPANVQNSAPLPEGSAYLGHSYRDQFPGTFPERFGSLFGTP